MATVAKKDKAVPAEPKKAQGFMLLTVSDTGKLISQIKTAGGKLDGMIDTAARCAAIHGHTHNDISLCEQLLLAMPHGSRINALRQWMIEYAPVGFIENKPVFSRAYKPTEEDQRSKAIANVETAPQWLTYKPEPAFRPFDFTEALAGLVKRAEAALKDEAHKDQNKINADQLAVVKALLPAPVTE